MTIQEFRAISMEKFNAKEQNIQERARVNIEKYRKGDHTLRLLDKNGQPAVGVRVEIDQKSHDFKHGANMLMLDEFDDPEINARYRDVFSRYFNLGTVPFYWAGTEPEEGKLRYASDSPKVYRRPPTDLCVEYCEEKGILPKLHCLFYDKYIPKWLTEKDRDTAMKLYKQRFADIARRYAGRMYEVEVTNELISTHTWTDSTPLAHERDIGIEMWELGRQFFPNEKLMINDTYTADVGIDGYRSPYFLMIENLLLKGATIDKIGVQNHIFVGCNRPQEEDLPRKLKHLDPELLFKGLEVLSSFGKPLEVTEVTIPTFGEGEEAEQLQADILRFLYTIWFSTPLMESIVYWNLPDNCAFSTPGWNENACRGGLFHRDMTPKLAALEHKRLFEEEWHTRCSLVTDEKGEISFRGFYGDYVAETPAGTFGFGIHKEGTSQTTHRLG